MQVTAIEPAYRQNGDGRFRTLAHFDLELTSEMKIYGMRLLEAEDGRRLTYAPSSGGRRFATFSPQLAVAITKAAEAAYANKGLDTANARRAA